MPPDVAWGAMMGPLMHSPRELWDLSNPVTRPSVTTASALSILREGGAYAVELDAFKPRLAKHRADTLIVLRKPDAVKTRASHHAPEFDQARSRIQRASQAHDELLKAERPMQVGQSRGRDTRR